MQDYERDNILEQYEIAVNSTRKTRGAILCSTDKGVFLMREVGVSEKRLPALIELYEYFGEDTFVDEKKNNGKCVGSGEF